MDEGVASLSGTGGYDKESRFTPEEVHAGPSMGQ